jgi:cell division septal protein FtsQ
MSVAFFRPRNRAEASRERRRRSATRTRSFPFVSAQAPAMAGSRRRSARRMEMPRRRSRSHRYEREGVLSALPSLPAVRVGWRMASGAIVLLFGALLFYVLSTPDYFVDSVNLGGATYVSAQEIYRASGLGREHIFWVKPDVVKANIEKVPGIISAQVEIAWPNQVSITVNERQPKLEWRQGGETVWVDAGGTIFPARAQLPDLLPVTVDDAVGPMSKGQGVPLAAIEGALQLQALRPNIELLHFDRKNGLSYQDGRGWRGYFGVGTNMEVKLAVYETLVDNLLRRRIHPTMINVSNPNAPFYRQ